MAGGKAIHCPSCSDETAVKHVGLMDGTGKTASIQVLAFDDEQEREAFKKYWNAVTGMGNGKQCHFAYLPSERKHKFRKVCEQQGNANHKGRM